jgi:hypothetical protein
MRSRTPTVRRPLLAAPLALALGASLAAVAPPADAQPHTVDPSRVPPRPEAVTQAAAMHTPVVRVKNAAEAAKMQEYLAAVRPAPSHVRHSFVAEAGHHVDCVEIEHQEAMLRPEARGHKVLSPPPGSINATAQQQPGHALPHHAPPPHVAPATRSSGMFLGGGHDASGNARSCPAGTVPTTRRTLEQLKSFETLADFHAKYKTHDVARRRFEPTATASRLPAPLDGPDHDHAGNSNANLVNYGAHSTLRVADPYVLRGYNEFSLSQIWVLAGDWADKSLQSLEVGVLASPDEHNGDGRPRLFVYSTTDAYDHHEDAKWWQTHVGTSCYNRDCGQFMQVDPTFDWNAPVTAGEVEVGFVKWGEAWWLQVNGRWIGYYPTYLYSAKGLHDRATIIDFGGEIVNANKAAFPPAHPYWHTTTAMGTGAFPDAGLGAASYQRNLMYFWEPNNLNAKWSAWGLAPHHEHPGCYRAGNAAWDANWGTYFAFGGPGYSWTSNDCKL